MILTRRIVLAILALTAVCLVPRYAEAQQPPEGVECSWTCICAHQLDDCDSEEEGWEACRDAQPKIHTKKIETCESCKTLAQAECKKQTCPKDPKKGPKKLFSYFCDGKSQDIFMEPERLHGIVTTSPSIGLLASNNALKSPASPSTSEAGRSKIAPPVFKCTFSCGCSVEKGMCDDAEQYMLICHDKKDSSFLDNNCDACRLRAIMACIKMDCPLVKNTRKVVSNFKCQVD